MKIDLLKEAFIEVSKKVIMAFSTWGIGVMLMLGYSFFILWLNKFNKYILIAGSLSYLIITFYIIDLWWYYHRISRLHMFKKRPGE